MSGIHLPLLNIFHALTWKNDSIYLPELVNRFLTSRYYKKKPVENFAGYSHSQHPDNAGSAAAFLLSPGIYSVWYHPGHPALAYMRYTGHRGFTRPVLMKAPISYKVAAWLEESARWSSQPNWQRANQLHIEKTDERVSNYLGSRNEHFRIFIISGNVLVVFKTIITAAMLIVGTLLLVSQQLNIGQFIAFCLLSCWCSPQLKNWLWQWAACMIRLLRWKLSNLTDKTWWRKNGSVQLPASGKGLKLE